MLDQKDKGYEPSCKFIGSKNNESIKVLNLSLSNSFIKPKSVENANIIFSTNK